MRFHFVTVNKQQLADLMGVAPGSIPRLVAQGMPPALVAGGGRGRAAQFDAVKCLAWQRQQLVADAPQSTPRDQYLQVLTDRARLELAQRQGQLVDIAIVRREWVDIATVVKTRLRAIPNAIAPGLVAAAAAGPAAVGTLLLSKIDEALRELARRGDTPAAHEGN
jgi:phage terminase Nu1 subunit (DNA packaging protein)